MPASLLPAAPPRTRPYHSRRRCAARRPGRPEAAGRGLQAAEPDELQSAPGATLCAADSRVIITITARAPRRSSSEPWRRAEQLFSWPPCAARMAVRVKVWGLDADF